MVREERNERANEEQEEKERQKQKQTPQKKLSLSSLSPWLKTSQAGSTFPNLCGESTSAMSSAADEGEEAEEEEELDDGGEETNGGSILSQKSAAATWSESKTATRSSGPISLPAGYIIPRAWLRLEALPLSSCGALGRLETYLTDEAEAEEEAPSDFASPATQAALAGSLPSSSSHKRRQLGDTRGGERAERGRGQGAARGEEAEDGDGEGAEHLDREGEAGVPEREREGGCAVRC